MASLPRRPKRRVPRYRDASRPRDKALRRDLVLFLLVLVVAAIAIAVMFVMN